MFKSKLYKQRNAKVKSKKNEEWYRRLVIEVFKKGKTLNVVKNYPEIKFIL